MSIEFTEKELRKLIEQLEALESDFEQMPMIGLRLNSGRSIALFKQLVIDAVALIRSEFSPLNDHFSRHISPHAIGGVGPSPNDLHEVCGVLRAAINQLHRLRIHPSQAATGVTPAKPPYVGLNRIEALRAIPLGKWDTRRLVRMLEELNEAHARGAYLTVAMMLRAVKDHVPPMLNQPNFAAVAANHSPGGGKAQSWKSLMSKLEDDMKHVADTYLHQQIRSKELLPDEPGVEFRAPLDMLLGEVARLAT